MEHPINIWNTATNGPLDFIRCAEYVLSGSIMATSPAVVPQRLHSLLMSGHRHYDMSAVIER